MADIHITVSRTVNIDGGQQLPLENAVCRSETVAIDDSVSHVSELVVEGGENVLTISAGADCWISIGQGNQLQVGEESPGSNRRRMNADEEKQFLVRAGDQVQVIAR